MSYTSIDQLKNAWVFKHKHLPINDEDLNKIKPMTQARSQVLWDTFISNNVDHPDFFSEQDWAGKSNTWLEQCQWEARWDSEQGELPEKILDHLNWDENTVVYFCVNRSSVIETTWAVFKRCWKNFLFMDDGTLLIGKKRAQAVQFLSNGNCKLGQK